MVVLFGLFSLWGVVVVGIVVVLLVLCYVQVVSYFDEFGGSYLYVCEVFGCFVGFEIGWMIWLIWISLVVVLSNVLVDVVVCFWLWVGYDIGCIVIIVVLLGFFIVVNVVGVWLVVCIGVILVIGKLLLLLLFVVIGVFYVDMDLVFFGVCLDLYDL